MYGYYDPDLAIVGVGLLLYRFYRRGNWGSRTSCDLCKVTDSSSRTRVSSKGSQSPGHWEAEGKAEEEMGRGWPGTSWAQKAGSGPPSLVTSSWTKAGRAFPVQEDLSMEEPQILSLFRGKHLQGSMTVAHSVPGYWVLPFFFLSKCILLEEWEFYQVAFYKY